MRTRILMLILPFFVVAAAIAGFVAVDYSRSLRHVDAGAEPSFTRYASARFDRLTGRDVVSDSETVAAIGSVPGTEAAPVPVVEEKADSGWFKSNKPAPPVEFTCTAGVGGSKVCTSLTD